MMRTARFSLRVILVSLLLSLSLGASALPLSPKWMKSSVEGKKVDEPRPGELDTGNGGGAGGVVQALPIPASLWLFAIGAAGMTLVRRKKA
jgi:hypothetical protein